MDTRSLPPNINKKRRTITFDLNISNINKKIILYFPSYKKNNNSVVSNSIVVTVFPLLHIKYHVVIPSIFNIQRLERCQIKIRLS